MADQIESAEESIVDNFGLTRKQKAWADSYIRYGNGRRASRDAEYPESAWDTMAQQNKRNPKIREYIESGFDEQIMGAKEVLARLTEIASMDLSPLIKDNGQIDFAQIKVAGLDRFVSEAGYDSNGNQKIKFHDKHAALRDLGRAHKLFGDSNTISGPGGGPAVVQIEFVNPPSEDYNSGKSSDSGS